MKTRIFLSVFTLFSLIATAQFNLDGTGSSPFGNNRGPLQGECNECMGNSLFTQLPVPLNWSATNDDQACYMVYENFWGVTGQIKGITFWGHELSYGSFDWEDCTPVVPKSFRITFFEDAQGLPGDVVSTFVVNPSKEFCMNTAWYTPIDPLYKYHAMFPSPVTLATGWISIRAEGGTDYCYFLWAGSVSDNEFEYQTCDSPIIESPRYDDVAFCLEGGSSEPNNIPVSSWALILGVALIAGFTLLRFRRLS